MAWACLMLAVSAPGSADDVVYINQRGFTIPIRVLPERRAEVRELVLYLSRDQGRTWETHARSAPDKKGFDFFANGDGMHYFSIAVVDQKGKQDPPDPYNAPVGQKICIDTVKPQVKIVTAQRFSDEVQLAWEIREDYPEWTSLRLEYKVGEGPGSPWTPLNIEPGERGNLRFRPGQPGPVTVRLSLRDRAQNDGVDERVVNGPAGPGGHVITTGGVAPPGSVSGPTTNAAGVPPTEDGNRGGSIQRIPTSSPGTLASSSTASPGISAPPPPTPTPTAPMHGGGAPLQIVNKRQVKLGFGVGKFGPSGLGTVEVYVTTDDGATWEKSPADPNVSLPVTSEVRGQAPVRGTVTVNLPRDGVVYGFYLVVKSRAGLGKPPPHSGVPPQVRIEVDTTLPTAELYAPMPDPASRDRLILSWKAEDRNLAPNPVSLEWAPAATGPWSFIGEPQLPNSGRYQWQVPANVPPKVYLRLSVRDQAGNNAIAQTDQPVLIDLQEPELVGDVKVEK
jgi:hypothetical protein